MKRNLLLMQDFMALLAYEEPDKSPMFHLLGLEYRQKIAESLNRAILGLLLDFLCASAYGVLRMLLRFLFFLHEIIS